MLNPEIICLFCRCSLPKYGTKTWYAQHEAVIRYPVLWLETNVVDHQHFTQKFPGGPYKFKEILQEVFKFQWISMSCRHPDREYKLALWTYHLLQLCLNLWWEEVDLAIERLTVVLWYTNTVLTVSFTACYQCLGPLVSILFHISTLLLATVLDL